MLVASLQLLTNISKHFELLIVYPLIYLQKDEGASYRYSFQCPDF